MLDHSFPPLYYRLFFYRLFFYRVPALLIIPRIQRELE